MSDWTHEFETTIPAPSARIFEALTDDSQLERWFAENARVEPHEGGAYRFWGRHTPGTPSESDAKGAITGFEPGARLRYTWELYGVPTEVAIALEPVETEDGSASTRVSLRQELAGAFDQPRPEALLDDWWRLALGNLTVHIAGHGDVLRPDFADPEPEIRLSMTVDAPPEAVFRALIEPEAVKEWFQAPNPVIDPRPGGRYSVGWKYTVDGREVEGGPTKILDIVPNERLVFDWPDWRGDPSVPRQSVAWHLEPEGAGTRVTLIHSGFVRAADFSDYPFGWGHFLSQLAMVAARAT